ncbi:LLM class flavin-dependent oxidoreductase [Myceligenerans pegani]|uniref:LLM class flavin-dependent oxidoreductase n=1 Tax=Myceligenerans pegani TaxID=2776917 RepID=A0ABR9N017_9MICO|nr:LLM class flavin-dependent oxidoreductase [Myceligenerans sp. TRM 65318]MBE1876995.1 LLM class flavin-dependent oxidoreductase [Myceligenerans sp. TRM 65318]MBE3019266.1 LLM class flavin-dependent oxidoreductase [Myceligenerans sp. TRM 65318]
MSTHTSPQLSVLDLVPVRTGQSSAQALAASLGLVALADRLGMTRYWFAEHHNMPGVAASSPPVMIAAAAARTERVRVGSGGVMLPNHAPLVVAEQFAALEALAPGRVDLGLGRAPGSDPVVSSLLRSSGPTADVERFPQHVRDILAMMRPDGARLRLTTGNLYDVRATPAAAGSPAVWLLGSSDYSARLAAELGLPYVFANHFAGQGMEQAVRLYRENYVPSEACPAPRTFLTMNTVVADTAEEARERALPQLRAFARMRTGRAMRPVETVEEALADNPDHVMTTTVEALADRWLIADPDSAAAELRRLAAAHQVDEVMIVPVAGSREDEPLDTTPGRARTLELLSKALAT